MALSFDELAAMFLARNKHVSESGALLATSTINRPFLNWLGDLITQYFQENFVVDEDKVQTTEAGLQLECSNSLNNDCSIAINISGSVLKPSAK